MVVRQRQSGKFRSRSIDSSHSRSPRLIFLLSILALTTSLLIGLQISRYHNGKSNIAIDRLLSTIGFSSKRQPQQSIGDTSTKAYETDAMKQRLAAIGKQFQEEIIKVKNSFKDEKRQVKGGKSSSLADSVASVPGEELIDHAEDIPNVLHNAPHVSDKSDEEAAEDQKIGLEDLDQDTLKAMFDALYSRQ